MRVCTKCGKRINPGDTWHETVLGCLCSKCLYPSPAKKSSDSAEKSENFPEVKPGIWQHCAGALIEVISTVKVPKAGDGEEDVLVIYKKLESGHYACEKVTKWFEGVRIHETDLYIARYNLIKETE